MSDAVVSNADSAALSGSEAAEITINLDETISMIPAQGHAEGSSMAQVNADPVCSSADDRELYEETVTIKSPSERVANTEGNDLRGGIVSRASDSAANVMPHLAAPNISSYFSDGGGNPSFFESLQNTSEPNSSKTQDDLSSVDSKCETGSEHATTAAPSPIVWDSGPEPHPSIASYFSTSDSQESVFDTIALPSVREKAAGDIANDISPLVAAVKQHKEIDPAFDSLPAASLDGGDERRSDKPFAGAEIFTNPFAVDEDGASQNDRAYDAWIPCAATQKTLMQVLTSQSAAALTLPPDQITMPGILSNDPQVDSVLQLLYRLKLDADIERRERSVVSKFTPDLNGLRLLLEAECWRPALELTGLMLTNAGQGVGKAGIPSKHTPDSLKVWTIRIALLMKLKMFAAADAECQTFRDFDGPDLWYECYPWAYSGRKGSMVPFSLRLMRAQLPQYITKHDLALQRLLQLRSTIAKILVNLHGGLTEDGGVVMIPEDSRNASVRLWRDRELRTLYSLAGCLADMKDVALAVKIYEEIASKDRDNGSSAYTSIGRLLLQVGDVNSARTYFHKAYVLEKDTAKKKFSETLNRGYISLACGKISEACEFFKEAALLGDGSHKALAVNNLAVSLLYNRSLGGAAVRLEECVRADPCHLINDCVLLNLSTLYDLASPNAFNKKVSILQLANECKGNAFSLSSFKLA